MEQGVVMHHAQCGYAGKKEEGILQGPCGPWQGFWVLFHRDKFSSISLECFNYIYVLAILC